MIRPQPEVAEVIRSCYDEFLERYGKGLAPEQRRTIDDLARCCTAALGGHVLECPQCGHRQIFYNSCGNRHCPKSRPPPRPDGWRLKPPICCPCLTMWSSRFPVLSARSPFTIPAEFTAC